MPQSDKVGRDSATAQRLLDAAAYEFARHGFAAARIRDIVDAAGANLAAVNYHFGGKEGLYQATLAMIAKRALEDMPGDSPEVRALPPEEQLRALARVMLRRYLGSGEASPLSRIIAYELLDPTPAIGQMLRGVSSPQWSRLLQIVAALLGPRACEEDIALASLSVAGQWVFFLFGRRMFEFQFPDLAGNPGLVDKLADHIAAFSVAAMRERRSRLEGERVAKATAGVPAPAAGKATFVRTRPDRPRMSKTDRSGN